MSRRSRPFALIGLDAADLDFIRTHRASLPTLRRLLDTGEVRRLRSTAGLLPGSVWPTFSTGRLPGVHGIYHHLQWDADAMQLRRVAADWLPCEPFWYALAARGLRVVVIDVPMTFPSPIDHGIEITNWGSHDQLGPFAARPGSLEREIRRRFGKHPMGDEIPVDKTPRQLEQIRLNLMAGARRKAELVRWALGLGDWDLSIIVFGETHRGGHILWPDAAGGESSFGALLDVYAAVDRALGGVLEAVERTGASAMVFSLHGMGPNTSQEHFVPAIMDRLNAAFVGGGRPSINGGGAARQRSLVRLLRERVPARLQNAVAQAVPVAVRDLVVNRQVTAGRVWHRTPALGLLADLNGYVRLNLRDREARGMLDRDGEPYRRYLEKLRRVLAGLRVTGSDQPLVGEVVLAAEAFPGERAAYLPDLVIAWSGAPPAERARSDDIGDLTCRLATGRGGNHRPDGFAILLPPPREGGDGIPGHIVDLAEFACRQMIGYVG